MTPDIKIVQLEGGPDSIDDDTSIVRYMKLETFLLLLDGQVFIPSHELLATLDPLEGNLLFRLPDDSFWVSKAELILQQIPGPIVSQLGARRAGVFARPTVMRRTETGDFVLVDPQKYARGDYKIWVTELSRERCVWCWNRFKRSSYALWRLYGDRGIALHSTVGRVKDALLNARTGDSNEGVQRSIVAAVAYINLEQQGTDPVLSHDGNIFLPHLLKSAEFDYEEEVRFILGVDYDILKMQRGVMVQIDPLAIVSEIKVSPYIRAEERDSLSRFVQNALERVRSRSRFQPRELGQEWTSAYRKLNPFTREDKPPAVFRDLK